MFEEWGRGREAFRWCIPQHNLCGAILVFLACFRGFSTGRSTSLCNIFWRGMKEYDKFTTIYNSVDTCGVCWLVGWGYFNDQSANKMQIKSENLKFEICFTDDQDVHMRLQTLKVSINCMWRRSWDISDNNRRYFRIWFDLTSALK